jgi:hypothetical protein
MVQLFVSPIQPGGSAMQLLSPFGKPCPVDALGSWACERVVVGGHTAYAVPFYIWAAAVTDKQGADIKQEAHMRSDGTLPIGPDALPPHIGGRAAVARLPVIRCARDQRCPGS